jgi:hypothetical protein
VIEILTYFILFNVQGIMVVVAAADTEVETTMIEEVMVVIEQIDPKGFLTKNNLKKGFLSLSNKYKYFSLVIRN